MNHTTYQCNKPKKLECRCKHSVPHSIKPTCIDSCSNFEGQKCVGIKLINHHSSNAGGIRRT